MKKIILALSLLVPCNCISAPGIFSTAIDATVAPATGFFNLVDHYLSREMAAKLIVPFLLGWFVNITPKRDLYTFKLTTDPNKMAWGDALSPKAKCAAYNSFPFAHTMLKARNYQLEKAEGYEVWGAKQSAKNYMHFGAAYLAGAGLGLGVRKLTSYGWQAISAAYKKLR